MTSARNETLDRAAMLDAVVHEALTRVTMGERVDFQGVTLAHPALMPELLERLRLLKEICIAGDTARMCPVPDSEDSTDAYFHEASAFFRSSLPTYELLEPLHYGGQGVVFRARHRSTGRHVALKVLLDGPLADRRQRRRFTREIELLRSLHHPNIISVCESGEVAGRQFLAMEYVEGLRIDDFVQMNGLDVHGIVNLYKSVCEAVSAAHQRGIIHRDLKPANVIVDAKGQPHVLDFGLATTAEDTQFNLTTISVAGQIVGTLPFLSPEQARGERQCVDVRSDVYSLGVMLFHLLTTRFPYPVDGDRQKVLANITLQYPRKLKSALLDELSTSSVKAHDLTLDLERIVAKALEKDSLRRYQSVDRLAQDLDRFLKGEAVEARGESVVYVVSRALRPFRKAVITGCVVSVLAIGGLIWVAYLTGKAQRGLEMGGWVRLASLARDEGRFDAALAMFDQAIALGADIKSLDPMIRNQFFSAYYQQGEMILVQADSDRAEPYIERAVMIANQAVESNPSEHSERLLAMAMHLRGKLDAKRGHLSAALSRYNEAALIYSKLADRSESQEFRAKVEEDLAFLNVLRGDVALKLKERKDSFNYYWAAASFYGAHIDDSSDPIDTEIELSRAQGSLARWFAMHPFPNPLTRGTCHALLWLARTRLQVLANQKGGKSRLQDIDQLLTGLANLGVWVDQH